MVPVLKILHILSVIVWMGVLLYMPRLFVYQTVANSKTEPERSILIKQYKLMANKLWKRVGWPAMGLTVLFGLGLMHPYFSSLWFWVKMGFVAGLIIYHHMIHFTNKALQKDKYTKSVTQLNTLNRTGAIFLLSIVSLAVLKDAVNYVLMAVGIGILIVAMVMAGMAMMKKTNKAS